MIPSKSLTFRARVDTASVVIAVENGMLCAGYFVSQSKVWNRYPFEWAILESYVSNCLLVAGLGC